jgi:Recombination directionality factor-like
VILDLQRRLTTVGRIRTGEQVPYGDNKTKPVKLETFRLTSPSRARIEEAAGLYGGTVRPWQAPAGKQWEVITEVDELSVIIPPGDMALSEPVYELWSRGGCLRRCNDKEATYVNEQGIVIDGDCQCDPDRRECKLQTRVSVMLSDMKGIGLWRIDTQSYYAATELPGSIQMIWMTAGRGRPLAATLRLDQRMVKRRIDGEIKTFKFAVPVIDPSMTSSELMTLATAMDSGTIAIESPRTAVEAPQADVGPAADRIANDRVVDDRDLTDEQRDTYVPADDGYVPPDTPPDDPWAREPAASSPAKAARRRFTPVPKGPDARKPTIREQADSVTRTEPRKRTARSAPPIPQTGVAISGDIAPPPSLPEGQAGEPKPLDVGTVETPQTDDDTAAAEPVSDMVLIDPAPTPQQDATVETINETTASPDFEQMISGGAAAETGTATTDSTPPPIIPAQVTRLSILLKELNYVDEKRHAYLSKMTQRAITSIKQLTFAEADHLINLLETMKSLLRSLNRHGFTTPEDRRAIVNASVLEEFGRQVTNSDELSKTEMLHVIGVLENQQEPSS